MARRRRPPATHGVVVVDKPSGVTSHDVVGMLRRRFGERQVGHGGTLDPSATGVLVVAVGSATKLLRFVEKTRKGYVGEVVLGSSTDTLDADGEVTATFDMSSVSIDDARAIISEHLVGDIEQIPPMVSALKVDGKRLHELAREGIEIERQPRPVTVHSFDVDETGEPGVWKIAVECSAGTYIRTLADDLGRLLGGGAHLRNLRRTSVGAFTLERSGPPNDAELLDISAAVAGLSKATVDAETAELIANGRVLPATFEGEPPWAIFDADDQLIAVYERFRDDQAGNPTAKPAVVLPAR